MKIIIIGEWYSTNIGDGVIGTVVEKTLNEHISNLEVYRFDMSLKSGYIDNCAYNHISFESPEMIKTRLITKIDNCLLRKKIYNKNLFDAAEQYEICLRKYINDNKPEAIVFFGGQMFMDYFLLKLEKTIMIAADLGIPVFFNACGISNHLSKIDVRKIRTIIDNPIVHYVSCRDGSVELGDKKIHDTFDTALILDRYYTKENKTGIIGLGIMYAKNLSVRQQIFYWRIIIKQLIEKGLPFHVFTNGNELDYLFAKRIIESIDSDNTIILEERCKSPNELITQISKYDIILSMRLHSILIAYSLGIKSIAISWDKKVNAFFKKAGISKYCFEWKEREHAIDIFEELYNDDQYFANKACITQSIDENIMNLCTSILDS